MEKPIRLEPEYKEMIWGGEGLKTMFNRSIPGSKIGESWEIHENNKVIGSKGTLKDLLKNPDIMGEKISKLNEFPLLVKIITAEDDLSIQVHPDDEYANKAERKPFGKTECWYVLEAPKDSKLIIGLKGIKDKEHLKKIIDNNQIGDFLNYTDVKKGDFFYIPAGLVHAITKNITILEVQQTSDITYRIYDYDRLGLDGKPRELHIDKSLDVINLAEIPNPIIGTKKGNLTQFVSTPYFTIEKYDISASFQMQLSGEDMSIFTCIEGSLMLRYNGYEGVLGYGDSVIIPAIVLHVEVSGNGVLMKSSYQ